MLVERAKDVKGQSARQETLERAISLFMDLPPISPPYAPSADGQVCAAWLPVVVGHGTVAGGITLSLPLPGDRGGASGAAEAGAEPERAVDGDYSRGVGVAAARRGASRRTVCPRSPVRSKGGLRDGANAGEKWRGNAELAATSDPTPVVDMHSLLHACLRRRFATSRQRPASCPYV